MRNPLLTLRSALLLLLLAATVPICLADVFGDFEENGIWYVTTSDNTVAVTSNYSTPYRGDISIPKTVTHTVFCNYEPVTLTFVVSSIDRYAFSRCSQLTSVSLPNTIRTIGYQAFNGCSQLMSITIPNSVETIETSAFQNCTGLTSVTVPNSVRVMGDNVFYGCTGLKRATLSSSTKELNGTFFGCTSLTSIEVPYSVTLLNCAFAGCTSLSSVVLPGSLKTIGYRSFEDCTSLTGLYIPNSVTTIGQNAFNHTGLTSLEIPCTTTDIGRDAFINCSGLRNVTSRAINPPVMANSGCFSNDTYNLSSFYVPNIVKNVYESTNWWSQFVNTIGKEEYNHVYDAVSGGIYYRITGSNTVGVTFKDYDYNSYSGSVTIPSTVTISGKTYQVTEVGHNAFKDCRGLTSVTIPTSVTRISSNAFQNSGLTALNLPNGLQYIGYAAFQDCNGFSSLTIPASVTHIGGEAFAGCDGITTLVWNAKNCHTSGNLSTANLSRATIGSQVEALPVGFVKGSSISQISLPESVTAISDSAFYNCRNLTSLTIPTGMLSIGDHAFQECSGLTTLYWNAVRCVRNGDMYTENITMAVIGDAVEILPSNFVNGSKITSISFPASVKQISDYAFFGCTRLTNLVIPETIQSIASYAFEGCEGLKSLTWNAIDCDYNGHMYCNNINQVSIGDKVQSLPNRFCQSAQITSVSLPNTLKSIGEDAFSGSLLQNVVIPNSVDTIGSNAFSDCQLQSIEIPSSVKYLGESAFLYNAHSLNTIKVQNGNPKYDSRNNCNALIETASNTLLIGCKNTTIPNSVISIGQSAFYNCAGLMSMNIPDNVTGIDAYAFYGCSGLTEVHLPENLQTVGDGVFNECSALKIVYYNAIDCQMPTYSYSSIFPNTLEQIIIGNRVQTIPKYFASGCTGLKSVSIPQSVTSIGASAFSNCSGLTSFTIPNSVTSIASSTFFNCTGLVSIDIPNSVTSIGSAAFSGCTSLASIDIPNALTSIENSVFDGCTSLTSIDIPNSVTSIGNYAFNGCTGLTEITIPSKVTSIGSYALKNCSALKTVYYNAENCQLNSYGSTFPNTIENMVVGNTVRVIPAYFLYGCSGLKNINIPNTVNSIGNDAFRDCTGLTDITLPDAITAIPYELCYNCKALSSVTIGADVESIEYNAFGRCEKLESFTSYSVDPPSISSWDSPFNGVPSTMVVYVPALALESYQSADVWKNYTIEPMSGNKGLTVLFPEGTEMSDYTDMQLVLSSADGNRSSHYSVTNKTSYTFNSIDKDVVWNVSLINQWNDVFCKIENITVQDQNVSVTLENLLKPQNVVLTVKTPDGGDVTNQCRVTWLDENGEILSQGSEIKRLLAGRKLNYQVSLPQELATAYTLPSTTSYNVKDGNNSVICQLTAITQTKLNGMVQDAASNQPLQGATVSAVQSFGGGGTKTLLAQTDNQGNYTMDVSSVPTTITATASGYLSQTVDCDMSGGSTIIVPDIALSPITGAVVNVNLTYTPAHAANEQPDVQSWYSDYNNVDYEVFNKTKNCAIREIQVQYPQIILLDDVDDGDVLEITAVSRKDDFKPVKTTVTLDEQVATATFNIVERGKIAAKFKKNINPEVVGTLYDADDKLVNTNSYSGDSLTVGDLADGNYKLITMGKSEFFNSIYDMGGLAETGLKRGVDYAQNDVNVATGVISPVVISEVPFFDETKFYYTGENTSFTVNKSEIVIGTYLTFRGQIDFKEQYANQVKDVQLIVDLPESCQFFDGSVLVAGIIGGYIQEGNRITIPMTDYNAIVRFCATPTVAGDFAPSAFVQFKINGKTITQPIGNANYHAKGLSLSVPKMTADTIVTVTGSAIGACDIDIYDNDVLIGHTRSLQNGSWSTKCELYNPYNFSTHSIYAKVTTDEGIVLQTDVADCFYDKNAIEVSKVMMYHENPEIGTTFALTFDFINPIDVDEYYTYYIYNRKFTFTIEFTSNDTTRIKDVVLYVKTAKSGWWPLDAVFDQNKGLWVASGEFGDMYDGDLPVNVSVDFVLINDENVDNSTVFEHEMSTLEELDRVSADQVKNHITVSLEEDENSYTTFLVSSDLSSESLRLRMDSLDYTNAYALLSQYQFTFAEDGIGYYCVKDLFSSSSYEAIIVDTGQKIAWKFTLDSLGNNTNNKLNAHAVSNSFVKNAINAFKRQDGTILTSGLGMFNDMLGLNKYAETKSFKTWVSMLEDYDNWDIKMREIAIEKILAKCPDGNYRIDENNRQLLYDRLLQIENAADGFHTIYIDYLDRYKEVLRNSALYDVGMNVATLGVGKLIEKGVWAGRILKNSKNANYFKYYLPLKNKLTRTRVANALSLIGGNLFGDAVDMIINPEVNDFQAVSKELGEWAPKQHAALMQSYTNLIKEAKSLYIKCGDDSEHEPEPKGYPYHGADKKFGIDPSGFVYEGVPSNRLQGVTATCYYKETVEDMYGDQHEEVVLWDASQYGQENPLLTDENGYYRWDVPIGMWQVKYEKEGYETTYSDWLPVPPPQLDVNIGMVQMRQPEVIKARAYAKAVEFEFDKFMLPETLTNDNITVTVNGSPVSGTIEMLNAELDDPTAITSLRRSKGTGLTLASRVRFNANSQFNADVVRLRIKHQVESYAGVQMNEDYVVDLTVENEMTMIYVDSVVSVPYLDTRKITVTVLPPTVSKGKTLTVRTVSPMIATTDAEAYTINRNGKATVTIHGDLPGMTSLLFGIEGYDLTAATIVNVMMEDQMTVATPTATIASGSEVEKGTAVYLRCSTPSATIYYTLDGSCPCDNTPARMVYDGSPIIINGAMTIKAMATAPDLYDSEVATFVYRVANGVKGDVNNDGEVNIADVNALIDIILGGAANDDTMGRADVNDDGEVNIADINTIIEMILNPSNAVTIKVNCGDLLHLNDLTIKPGETRAVNVMLDNAPRYSAMQCDIVLPDGLSLVAANAASGNVSKTSELSDSTSRIVTYSMTKHSFGTQAVPVLSFEVRADAALASMSQITLANVVLADDNNVAWRVADCVAQVNNVTGLNDLTATTDRVWVEGHTLCILTQHDTIAQLVTVNGMTWDLPVESGINRQEIDPGVYVIILNGNSHKIAVK